MSDIYYFYANPMIPDSVRAAERFASLLKDHTLLGPAWLCEHVSGLSPSETVPEGTCCALAFGGDGTLLRLAPLAGRAQAPVLGVHAGHVGFLMQGDVSRAEEISRRLTSRDFTCQSHPMLEVTSPGGVHLCLNDVSITRGVHPGILEVQVTWNGEKVFSPHGDGVILSTTLGSTAYNMAAGGPIVHPQADVLILTPVCAREQLSRPTVLPFAGCVTFTLPTLRRDAALLSIDGQTLIPLQGDDQVTVRPAREKICMVQMQSPSFFDTLRHKTALWNGL